MINDAYDVLCAIVTYEQGRSAFISHRGVQSLCEVCVGQTFQCERAVELVLSLLRIEGPRCWSYHKGEEDYQRLVDKFAGEFERAQDAAKFVMCETVYTVLRSSPGGVKRSHEVEWAPKLQKGLQDILFSKIAKEQRDPAIKLLAAVIEVSGFEWCLEEREEASSSRQKGKFLLVALNLACIEVIMHLEEQSLLAAAASADLLASCYTIMENAVTYMANERFDYLDERQRNQLFTALKNGFATVLKFLEEAVLTIKDDPKIFDDNKIR